MEFIYKLLTDFANWLGEKLKELFDWAFGGVLDAFALIFEQIPVPGFFATASGAFSSIPSGVVFFLSVFELNFGISVILTAYALRFIIRRIPFFG